MDKDELNEFKNQIMYETKIEYESEYCRLKEMNQKLTEENEELKRALVKIALKL